MMTMLVGVLNILRELKVEKVIIGQQGDVCEQYDEFCKIASEKQIPVVVVKKGDIINIEKDLKIRILFPEKKFIAENMINNNSLVAKLEYKDLKVLFTGDIEEEAEKRLVEMYCSNELEANILKVPHHGSKSSSTLKFLENVKPSIALIGVGKNNKFKHPSEEVVERLQLLGIQIYRTDEMGEITIKSDGKNIKEAIAYML